MFDRVRTVVPDVIRQSYAVKFGIVILVIGLAIGAVGLGGTSLMAEQVEQSVNSDFESTATSDALTLDNWLESNAAEMRTLERNLPDSGASDSAINEYLQTHQNDVSDRSVMTLAHVVDTETNTIEYSSRSAMRGETFDAETVGWAGEPDFEIGDVGVSPLYVAEDDYHAIAFVTDLEGSQRLVTVYDIEDVGDEILSGGTNAEYSSSETVVVNSNGTIVMADARLGEAVGESYPSESPALERVRQLEARTVSESTTVASQYVHDSALAPEAEHLVGFAPSGPRNAPNFGSDWAVLVHAPSDEAYGFAGTLETYGLYATLLGILFAGVIGAVVGRNTAASINRLTDRVEEMEDGNLEADFSTGRIDEIGRLYEGFDEMQQQLKERIEEAERARKEAEVSRAEAMEMSNYLQEKADEYAQIMQQCAAGDLTRRMEPDGENEAMDRIAGEFNEMIDELEKTTGQLKSFADEVETAGEVVQTSSESVRDASEQVADSIQQISDDAHGQKERLQEISSTMDDIARDLETFAADNEVDFGESLDRIEEVATALNDVVELSEQTMAESENVAGAAEEQAAELNEVSQRAEDLSRYARPLKEVLDRFETESEHEFYFPTGPGSGEAARPDEGDE
ncbi:HAMP domain-containing protein [Halapricum desulfuricans]|uniref:Methyl-accepting chemotaxis protein n=1 Tax=Halapricum desulfuricans TaxID=2841257 RepID=A0A897N3B8_9EURY|nr:methyl-accepting chemotaxis protein [Halapricum desulfuricans]QSG06981.1 Methyl-accepting chemotaxis protein [Halapricum desulfuricans]